MLPIRRSARATRKAWAYMADLETIGLPATHVGRCDRAAGKLN